MKLIYTLDIDSKDEPNYFKTKYREGKPRLAICRSSLRDLWNISDNVKSIALTVSGTPIVGGYHVKIRHAGFVSVKKLDGTNQGYPLAITNIYKFIPSNVKSFYVTVRGAES